MSATQNVETVEPRHRPEFVSHYHYPKGSQSPFEHVVLDEQCYINLEPAGTCPRCSSTQTRTRHADGPARTARNHWKVWAYVYVCDNCNHGYTVAEVID